MIASGLRVSHCGIFSCHSEQGRRSCGGRCSHAPVHAISHRQRSPSGPTHLSLPTRSREPSSLLSSASRRCCPLLDSAQHAFAVIPAAAPERGWKPSGGSCFLTVILASPIAGETPVFPRRCVPCRLLYGCPAGVRTVLHPETLRYGRSGCIPAPGSRARRRLPETHVSQQLPPHSLRPSSE